MASTDAIRQEMQQLVRTCKHDLLPDIKNNLVIIRFSTNAEQFRRSLIRQDTRNTFCYQARKQRKNTRTLNVSLVTNRVAIFSPFTEITYANILFLARSSTMEILKPYFYMYKVHVQRRMKTYKIYLCWQFLEFTILLTGMLTHSNISQSLQALPKMGFIHAKFHSTLAMMCNNRIIHDDFMCDMHDIYMSCSSATM